MDKKKSQSPTSAPRSSGRTRKFSKRVAVVGEDVLIEARRKQIESLEHDDMMDNYDGFAAGGEDNDYVPVLVDNEGDDDDDHDFEHGGSATPNRSRNQNQNQKRKRGSPGRVGPGRGKASLKSNTKGGSLSLSSSRKTQKQGADHGIGKPGKGRISSMAKYNKPLDLILDSEVNESTKATYFSIAAKPSSFPQDTYVLCVGLRATILVCGAARGSVVFGAGISMKRLGA
eukprot:CAMPEP_0184696366 /NCGR_PEP_ID=MMETSP0313-20130426/3692_1 /TAXON_ID=2792 /ORGANISM="Porphyridium aerugineum, Strain SAG 1380-2" /LENGTH=228 /DNA_ID=CAMNT_0027154985 /DNA_START=55 /DNA_END=742 /DNA_ORIENTATION=+